MIDLSREIKLLINENDDSDATLIERKLKQLKLINSAMALLYLSVVSFVLAALFSGLKENAGWEFQGDIYVLLLGILVAVLALLSLMLYSFRAVKLRQDQYHKKC
jgi:hypothetical protein